MKDNIVNYYLSCVKWELQKQEWELTKQEQEKRWELKYKRLESSFYNEIHSMRRQSHRDAEFQQPKSLNNKAPKAQQ